MHPCADCGHPVNRQSTRCRSCAARHRCNPFAAVSTCMERADLEPIVITPVPPETLAKVAIWRAQQPRARRIPIGVVIEATPFVEEEFEPNHISTYGRGARAGVVTCSQCASRMPGTECPRCHWKPEAQD